MSKILITGGAGYVGAVLTPYLLKKGHKITVIDLMIYGEEVLSKNRVSLIICFFCKNTNEFRVLEGDTRSSGTLRLQNLRVLEGVTRFQLRKFGNLVRQNHRD